MRPSRVDRRAARRGRAFVACALAVAIACALAGARTPAVALAAPPAALSAPADVAHALDYLHACQRGDGGFAEKGGASSSDAVTAWAVIGIAAAGEDPRTWRVHGRSPVDYLARDASAWTATTDYARTALAAVAARRDPRSFGGVDLVARILSDVQDRGSDGDQIGAYVNSHVWGMLALEAAGYDVSGGATKWLLRQQNDDGGWGWAPGVGSDTNDTAAALQALIAAGQRASSSAIKSAVSYLRARQAGDGGFVYQRDTTSDADSTAWVIQALVAAGESPAAWVVRGHTPLDRLRALQGADGSVRYGNSVKANPLLVTVQALSALAQEPFPLEKTAFRSSAGFRPSVSPRWPASGSSVPWFSDSALAFVVDDGHGVGVDAAGITVTVDGVRHHAALNERTGSASAGALAIGPHVAAVSATDRAGNRSVKCTWRFTVTSAPAGPTPATETSASSAGTAKAGGAIAASIASSSSSEALTGGASGMVAANTSGTLSGQRDGAGARSALGTLSLAVAGASLLCAAVLVGWRLLKRR